ncbi:MAG: PD-(D/E)XK nuclease family protein [Syntrophobacterales bacterium]|jgi:RecB family exonuclease
MLTTDQWQQDIIDSWRPGSLILTSGGRLARQLQHRYRLQQLENDHNSWHPLNVRSLNSWLHQSWQDLWESRAPAGFWLRLRLWYEIMRNNPPPADLPLDLALCQLLDQTYAVLVRHRLDPTQARLPSPLIAWRQHICREFISALNDFKRYHPSELPLKIAEAVNSGRLSLPDSLILAAFEAPAPIENDLFRLLSQQTHVNVFSLPHDTPKNVHAVTLPDQEQEIFFLGQALLDACLQFRPGAIGVVVPNLEVYTPVLRKTLNTLLGQPSTPQEETYNITLGSPLLEHPLVQAALLPFRLLGEEEKRQVLISLILSPYYLAWASKRHQLARLDRIWREMSPETGLDSLYARAEKSEPDLFKHLSPGGVDLRHLLVPFQKNLSLSAAEWKKTLEKLWNSVQFPSVANESDRIASNHLQTVLDNLADDLGSWIMDAQTFQSWLRQALSVEIFQIGASEQAGVQIMGLIESRGLAFERLFLLGMTSTALPQPVRPLPFLDTDERRQILGATLKSQYEFAHAAFQHLLAAAPEIILTKPEKVDGEPASPTPFWPSPWQSKTVSIWTEPDAAWARAAWLRSAWRGFVEPHSQEIDEKPSAVAIQLPDSLSVSSLAVAFHCPFRFLIEELLGLKPLPEPMAGLRPENRGQSLHQILACITRKLRPQYREGDLEWQQFLPSAQKCVDKVLTKVAALPPWQVERSRLLGDKLGLLRMWFQEEINHNLAGWRWLAEEIPFKGLRVEGWPTALSGRIDRIDFHPETGLLCWDYKSGSSPNSADVFTYLSEPQLPAYLLALLQGLVEVPGHPPLQEYPFQAGYITLKSEKDIKLDRLQADAERWQHFLETWRERLVELGQLLQQGYFDADPIPTASERKREQQCNYCGLLTICHRKNFQER